MARAPCASDTASQMMHPNVLTPLGAPCSWMILSSTLMIFVHFIWWSCWLRLGGITGKSSVLLKIRRLLIFLPGV